jgi:Tol biopolymer transport system component
MASCVFKSFEQRKKSVGGKPWSAMRIEQFGPSKCQTQWRNPRLARKEAVMDGNHFATVRMVGLAATTSVVLAACGQATATQPASGTSVPVSGSASSTPAVTGVGSVTITPQGTAEPTSAASSPTALPVVSPTPGTSAPASSPRLSGSIAYMHEDAAGAWQTWVACADLSHAQQLTAVADRGSGWPVWSPDGVRIAIDTDREDPDTSDNVVVNDIFTMKADGSDLRKLTDSVGLSGDPGYSPDGKLIVFQADRGTAKQSIYVMNAADGTNKRQVTTVPDGARDDHAPRFSPDGMRIVFTREVDDFTSSLFVVNLDGSGVRKITTASLHPGDAVWSPIGSDIAFEADLTADGRTGPWIVGADGGAARSLTGPQDFSGTWNGFSDPTWSPDGSAILVMHGVHQSDGSVTAGLATINPDGTNLGFVGDGTGMEHQADWTAARTC